MSPEASSGGPGEGTNSGEISNAHGHWSEQEIDPAGKGGRPVLPPPPEPAADLDKKGVVEALLLVSPSPLSAASVAEITGFEPGAVREMINALCERYDGGTSGIVLREVAGGFAFYARPDAAPYISRLISTQVNPRLTRAALETLAIVAYLQPVSRGVVAEIRGVQSEGVMKTLEDRGLVRVTGKGGAPGYPALYGTTSRFLERFGLRDLEDLPPLEEFAPDDETLERIRLSLSWELVTEGEGAQEGAGEDSEDPGGGGSGLEEGF